MAKMPELIAQFKGKLAKADVAETKQEQKRKVRLSKGNSGNWQPCKNMVKNMVKGSGLVVIDHGDVMRIRSCVKNYKLALLWF